MAAITISRQYGSGGRKIALRVSELLNWRLFDKQLMMQVATEVGLMATELIDFTEEDYRIRTFWERLFSYDWPSALTSPVIVLEGVTAPAKADEEWYVSLTSATILSAYERGNMVIVGRGGQVLLQDKPDVLHVRVVAPMHKRIQRLQTVEELSTQEALELPSKRDKASVEYMRRFFDVHWDDPQLYHLTINTGKWDIEAAAQIISSSVGQL